MKKTLAILLSLILLFSLISPVYGEGNEEEDKETSTQNSVTTNTANLVSGCKTLDAQSSFGGSKSVLKTSKAAFLYECNSDTVLYSYNPDMRVYPGALTKIMTCLLLVKRGNPSDEITVKQSMLDEVPWDVYGIDLVVGEKVTLEQMLLAIMVESANDAIVVCAMNYYNSLEQFIEEMNLEAQRLGCTGTHFSNPYGLHDEDNYTTARDMAKITVEASKYQAFLDAYGTAYCDMPATNMSESRYFHTTNYMIYSTVMFNYYDPSITGGRVGTTYEDTYNAVISSKKNNASYIVVTMEAERTLDAETAATLVFGNLEDARSLLDYAYDEYKIAETVCEGQAVAQYPVVNGSNDVALGTKEGVISLLPVNMTSAEIQRVVNVDESLLRAPLEDGVVVGTVECWFRNYCVGTTELVTLAPVAVSTAKVPLDGVVAEEEVVTEEKSNVFGSFLEVLGAILLFLLFVFLVLSVRTFIIRSRHQKRMERRREAERRRRR